jgi:alcohol dehydrogenase class IV
MGHSWSAIYGTPHGQSIGLFLRYVTQYVLSTKEETNEAIEIYSDMAKKLGWANWDEKPKKAASKVVDKIKEIQEKVDFITNLKDLGVDRENFEGNLTKLVSLCFQDPSSVMAPRIPNKEDFIKIYKYAYEGKDVDF